VERLSNRDARKTITDAAGLQTTIVLARDATASATYPEGTTASATFGPDPRWGMQAPIARSQTVTTPGGRVQTTTTTRTVTLATPSDLLSLRTMNETTTINGRASTLAYDAATRTFTGTSPASRRTTAVLDARGRVVQEQLGDLEAISYMYDSQGRLASAAQGPAGDGGRASLAMGLTAS